MTLHTKPREERLADLQKELAKLQKELRKVKGYKRGYIVEEIRGVCQEIEKLKNG